MENIVKKGWIITFFFVVTLAFSDTGPRIYYPNGNFSIRPPFSWQAMEIPGYKYKFIFGPIEYKFAANIGFVDEYYSGNLRSYVNENLTQMGNYFVGYKMVSRNSFTTSSAVNGERVIYTMIQNDQYLRAVVYFLPSSNSKYFVVTCISIDSVFEKYIALFDESIKTIEFD
jgi:hypothetical protein